MRRNVAGPRAIGSVVAGKFRVETKLASGAMGAVWIAVQEPLGRKVALKVIRGGIGADNRARFEREAKIVARLGCPHVVTLFDFGEHDGAPYIVFELLNGESLRERLGRGRVPLASALSIARDICCGLRAAHEMGIIHRDLKPSNVMLVPDKDLGTRAKLVDFGIAKLFSEEPPDAPGQTAVGAVIGTAGYIAPEVATHGQSDDPRLDLYALGVILFEMLCGAPPFDAPTAMSLIVAHATRPVPDVRERNADVPPPVASLISRLLAKDPNARPRDAEAVIAEIDALRAGENAATPAETMVTTTLKLPDRPSIAVQPFMSIGGTDGDVLFAEGISEEIQTALSRFRQLFVVSPISMLSPSGRDTDPLRVGRVMGVRFVVQGSVRRSGDRLRVSAKLVDVERGVQLWGNRYDIGEGDVFEMQDDVTQRVVACVAGHVEVAQAERARRMPPHALDAYDWFARGRAHHHRRTADDNAKSREALDRAVELDPEYAAAHAWRACAYGQALGMGALTMEDGWPAVFNGINRALELDDGEPECHRLACELAFGEGNLVKAEFHHRRAIELNPNDARIVGQAGELAMYKGNLEEAAEAFFRAMRLEPLNPKPFQRLLMRVRYVSGNLEEAWRLWRCVGEGQPTPVAVAAAVAAMRGDDVEAAQLAARVRSMAPHWSAQTFTPRFANEELRERWLHGFAHAGLL